jgi:hypothetical protein
MVETMLRKNAESLFWTRKEALVFLLGVWALFFLSACEMTGVVRDSDTHQPVSGAKIVYRALDGTCVEAHTDQDGLFVLDSVTDSPLLVVVEGYLAHVVLDPGAGVYFLTRDPDPGADLDADGLSDAEELSFGTDPENPDSDRDGLLDGWEVRGVPDETGEEIMLYLSPMGALPLRQDIFVEIDWMENETHSEAPIPQVIASVIKTFQNAPTQNPDGSTGISLHVDFGQRANDGGNAVPFIEEISLNNPDYAAIKEVNFAPERYGVYHYCLFAYKRIGTTSSGSAEINGDDFLLSLGGVRERLNLPRWADLFIQRGTFIHELGHNLNLRHGGQDNINYKPNYESSMNYRWQMTKYDYSREEMAPLDENALDESEGIGRGPVDWNKNRQIDPGLVAADINHLGFLSAWIGGEPDGYFDVLFGYHDWANLDLTMPHIHTARTISCDTRPEWRRQILEQR